MGARGGQAGLPGPGVTGARGGGARQAAGGAPVCPGAAGGPGPRRCPLCPDRPPARCRCRGVPAVLALCAAAWSCAAGPTLERDQPFR